MVATSTRQLRRALAMAVIPVLLFLGSCSESVSPLCEDAQNLKDAVQELTQVDFATGGADALRSALDDVDSSVAALGDEAKNTFSAPLSAIQAQLTALGRAVDEVQAGAPVASVAPDVRASLSDLKTALSDLESTAQSQDCNLE